MNSARVTYGVNLQQAWMERLARLPHEPDLLSRAVRCSAALLTRSLLRVYNRLQITGRQHLPLERSFIIVANHTSHLDTVCLQAALPLRKVHEVFPAAASDYFFNGKLPRAAAARVLVNAIPFARRGHGVRECMNRCRKLLEDPHANNILIVYPEGTRSTNGDIAVFKRGIGDLVAGRDVPVVPCYIDGGFRAWPKGAWLPRPARLRLTFGPPRTYAHHDRSKASTLAISEDLRREILVLQRTVCLGAAREANYSNVRTNIGIDFRTLIEEIKS